MTTLKQLLDELAEQFTIAELEYGHGTDNPWDEAVALSLGWLRWADDATNLGRDVPPADLTQIKALAHRRVAQRVPVPLLLGHTHFAGIEFDVTPGVMIPRSPFAELIQGGFQPWLATPPGRILDLCSGGGCIGIACALHWPQAEVVLADLESAACELARVNVIKHGLTERVTVVQSNLFEHLEDRFDLILSNPPSFRVTIAARAVTSFGMSPIAPTTVGLTGWYWCGACWLRQAITLILKVACLSKLGSIARSLRPATPGCPSPGRNSSRVGKVCSYLPRRN